MNKDFKLMESEISASTSESEMMNPRARFVFEHNTCAMCETELEIQHQINTKELKLKEEAHCPSCGIRVRSTSHFLN